jgi:hypothetical protein
LPLGTNPEAETTQMPKLHHVLAIETSTKTKVAEKLTAIYKAFQKPDLFNGHVKSWTPKDSNQESTTYEMLPDERREVQQNANASLKVIRELQSELFDLTLQRDATNMLAKADVVVDGVVILKDAPVTYLLWLSHQLDDLHTEVKKVPTLDPAEKWSFDRDQNLYATPSSEQIRTKKLQVPLVLYPPTKEHPAQVKEITQDVITGTWKTIKYSSAMPVDERDKLLTRVEKLQHAVKQARETANDIEVAKGLASAGKAVFDFVFQTRS